jgi:hypothetical protein
MTDDNIKEFAREHAPALAKNITELCGSVIAKGLEGILQHCVAMQLRIEALEATLRAHGIPLYELKRGSKGNDEQEQKT